MIGDVSHVTVSVWGEVDADTSEILFQILVSMLSVDAVRSVSVDLANVSFLAASGVGVLLAAQNRAGAAGKVLGACGATGMPLQVLEVTGVLGGDPHPVPRCQS